MDRRSRDQRSQLQREMESGNQEIRNRSEAQTDEVNNFQASGKFLCDSLRYLRRLFTLEGMEIMKEFSMFSVVGSPFTNHHSPA